MAYFTSIETEQSSTKINSPPQPQASWLQDIAAFDTLLLLRMQNKERQSVLRDQLEYPAVVAPTADPNIADVLAPKPHDRTALKEELELLEERLANLNTQSHEVVTRVLTHDPVDVRDAGLLLAFVARILKTGSKIEAGYVSDVLEACAAAALIPSTPMDEDRTCA